MLTILSLARGQRRCGPARVLFGADLGKLMLDAHADRRAGVQGFEAAGELVRVPVQFDGGELGDLGAVIVRHGRS
jgi:hypothetical protein